MTEDTAISIIKSSGLKVSKGPREGETTVTYREVRGGIVQSITTQVWPTDMLPAIAQVIANYRTRNCAWIRPISA